MASLDVPDAVTDAWLSTIANLVAVRSPLSTTLYERLVARGDWSEAQRAKLLRLAPWVGANAALGDTPVVNPGEIPFAVMGYQTPDPTQTSRNIGDWVQTVSLMSHLLRRPDVDLVGHQPLVDILTSMRERIPAEHHIDGPEARVRLIEVNRDATLYDAMPEGTWTLVFGWFMKRILGAAEQFPLNPKMRPIFVSFHISHGSFLTSTAIEYLKANAPIGCRDWHTARLLISRGIPAYFSGCVTTTIGSLFPAISIDETKPVAYVDVEPDKDAGSVAKLKNLENGLRERPLADALKQAYERIDAYRTQYSGVVTGRLHAYLPAESCGVRVEWKPSDPNDRRFNGLVGPTAGSRTEMRARLSEILQIVLDAILRGEPEAEVRRLYYNEVEGDMKFAAQKLGLAEPGTIAKQGGR